jgi:N-acetylglucosaminyl-diphospho-decaprenol L-rhamnosyltransferase
MRKHHGGAAAFAVRALTAWTYSLRALVAAVLPNHPAKVYWAHARQALLPSRGAGIADTTHN